MDSIASPRLACRIDAASGQAGLNAVFETGIVPNKHAKGLCWTVLRLRAASNCASGSVSGGRTST